MAEASESGSTVTASLRRAYLQMESGDVDGLMELYAEDAVIQSAGQPPVCGAPAIRRFWSELFQHHHVRLAPQVVDEVGLGEVVVVRGTASGTLTPRQGDAPPVRVEVWFLQVYRRGRDGRLRFWRGANGPQG